MKTIPIMKVSEPKAPFRTVAPPARTPAQPYRAYKPAPFTREERGRVTVLFGGLHWRAERVIQGAVENLGYRTQVLPTATREDLLTGHEVADIGQCCPTSFTRTSFPARAKSSRAQVCREVGREKKWAAVAAIGCRAAMVICCLPAPIRKISALCVRLPLPRLRRCIAMPSRCRFGRLAQSVVDQEGIDYCLCPAGAEQVFEKLFIEVVVIPLGVQYLRPRGPAVSRSLMVRSSA